MQPIQQITDREQLFQYPIKISQQETYSGNLKTKLYITQKSKGDLNDQAMDDVITLASNRTLKDKNKTKEQLEKTMKLVKE